VLSGYGDQIVYLGQALVCRVFVPEVNLWPDQMVVESRVGAEMDERSSQGLALRMRVVSSRGVTGHGHSCDVSSGLMSQRVSNAFIRADATGLYIPLKSPCADESDVSDIDDGSTSQTRPKKPERE
jgi:hypothetical protein